MRNLTKLLILFLMCFMLYGQASEVLQGTVMLKGRILGNTTSNIKVDSVNTANLVATEKVILDIAAGSLTLQDGTILYFTDGAETDSAYMSHDGTDFVITGDGGTTALELEGLELELSNGCTIVNTDANNLAITEANVNIVGNLFLDASAGTFTVSDGSYLYITDGTEADSFSMVHDGSKIIMSGDAGTGDLELFDMGLLVADAEKILWTDDSEADTAHIYHDGTDLILTGDGGTGNLKLADMGVSISSEVVQAFKAEYNITSQLGAWVHGVKVELTRAADIQPATGAWFAGQFVLNVGSSGYTDLNKPAYALQAVMKGSDVSPNGNDFHVGRFETQSSADVSDIVYITANSGTTVQGHMLYLADHTGANGQLINVQSSQTMAKAISFLAGSGSTMTSLLYASGDGTFTNFLEVAASGDGGVTTSGMTNDDPNDVDEDGYILIKIGAQTAKIPFWYDD